jgi:hypothetical protein
MTEVHTSGMRLRFWVVERRETHRKNVLHDGWRSARGNDGERHRLMVVVTGSSVREQRGAGVVLMTSTASSTKIEEAAGDTLSTVSSTQRTKRPLRLVARTH